MTKNTKPAKVKKDDPEQSKRFVETARKLKVEKDGEAFERALDAISENSKNDTNQ